MEFKPRVVVTSQLMTEGLIFKYKMLVNQYFTCTQLIRTHITQRSTRHIRSCFPDWEMAAN